MSGFLYITNLAVDIQAVSMYCVTVDGKPMALY